MPITISGSGTVTGISAGGLPDDCITTAEIAANAVTTAKLGTNEASGLAKAWVNFDGVTAGTFAGGTSTVSRTAGSTTATVTTTNAHGLITGNAVWALTGVVAGAYTVTVLTTTTFTITTVATTVLTAASITFQVATIRAGYNVSSVAKNGAGDYTVNFATAMPDVNYAAVGCSGDGTASYATGSGSVIAMQKPVAYSTSSYRMQQGSSGNSAGVGTANDTNYVSVTFFR
jgi:hypothetical protein